MAGIFGYLKKGNNIDDNETLGILKKHASQGFNHNSNHRFLKNGAIGFAAPFYNSSWPLLSKDGNYIFQVFGEIFLPDGTVLSKNNFDDFFLIPFLKEKLTFLKKLDGAFVFCLIDKKRQTLFLCNDAFGNYSTYYNSDSNIFLFSMQAHAITEILGNREWDLDGLNQYLGLGFTMNGKSYYQNIKRLQPAELLILSGNKFSTQQYFKCDYKQNSVSNNDIHPVAESIIESIRKRLDSNSTFGAAITGGFDSRVTWGIINHLNLKEKVVAFTHGLGNSRDIQISKKITQQLNLNHKINVFDDSFIKTLPGLWEQFIKHTEGNVVISSAHALKSWEFGSSHYKTLLDSHGGVLFRRQFMKVAEKRIKSIAFTDQLFKYIKSPLLGLNVLKDDIMKDAVRSSLDGINEYYALVDDSISIATKIDLFYLYQISPYKYSAAANAQMDWVMLSHPLLNIKTFNLLQKVHSKDRANQSIYKHIINETSPVLKSFYLENMGMPAPYYGFTYLRYIPMIYERIINKTIRKTNYSLYKKLSIQKFVTDYDLFFRINFDSIKDILLRENDTFNELVDKKKVQDLIILAEQNIEYRLSSWSSLITLKLFLDIFHK